MMNFSLNRVSGQIPATALLPLFTATKAIAGEPLPVDRYEAPAPTTLSAHEELPDGPQDLPHTPSTFEIVSDPTFLVLTGLTVFQGVMFTSLTRMLSFMGGLSMAENSLKMNTHRAELLAQRIRRDAMTARDDTERNTLKNEGKLLEAYRDPIQSDFSKAQDFHGKLKSNWMYAFINFMANPALEYFARESLILPPENPEKSLKKIDDAVRMSGA